MEMRLLSVGLLGLCGLTLASASVFQEPVQEPTEQADEFVTQLAEDGIRLDREAGTLRIDGQICQLYEPLEYLLVKQPQGKDHESLLSTTEISPTVLNAAMLFLGVEKGENGHIVPTEPAPSLEEVQSGILPYTFFPATGDGFYMYVSWEVEVDGVVEHYRYRAEDLVLNVREESTYQRGKFVYLGSRFIRPHKDAKEFYSAEGEGNLVSLVNFSPAGQILAGSDPSADNQSIWYPNVFLLPEIGYPVEIWFTRELLEAGVQ